MDEYFNTFKSRLRGFKLDDALLHLNFILQASQNPDLNTDIYNFALENPDAVADYKVEFTAKWLIVESNFDSSVILSMSLSGLITSNYHNFLTELTIQLFMMKNSKIVTRLNFLYVCFASSYLVRTVLFYNLLAQCIFFSKKLLRN